MAHKISKKNNVDIHQYPKITPCKAAELTIGDLHANFMFLMHFLVSNGIVTLTENDYKNLLHLYQKHPLEPADIDTINTLIGGLNITDNAPLLRFIGDEVADRGKNDYFMFKLFQKLDGKVPFEILLSNHGIEFLEAYEKRNTAAPSFVPSNQDPEKDSKKLIKQDPKRFDLEAFKRENVLMPSNLFFGQARSLEGLNNLVKRKVITLDAVEHIVKEGYLPHLKLLSYSLDNKNITLYTHAGVGLETIKALVDITFKKDTIVYKDDTAQNLAHTIDALNKAYAEHVKAGTVHTLIKNPGDQNDYKKDPLKFLIWNRGYSNLKRPKTHNNYQLHFVHGHDLDDASHDNIHNLDNACFKHDEHRGSYNVLEHYKTPAARLQPEKIRKKSEPSSNPDSGINPIKDALDRLGKKARDLYDSGYSDAAKSAIIIHKGIIDAFKALEKDNNHNKFNDVCTEVIAKNRSKLDTHRGWSEFLVNLLLLLTTAGIGLLIKGIVNVSQNRHFLFVHNTASGALLDNFNDKITNKP